MGDKHVVRFEPVGIEIEVDEERAAFHANYVRGGPAGRPAPAEG